jgi:hypothetical protein
MNRLAISAIAVLALALGAGAQEPQEFRSERGRFSVKFPGAPLEKMPSAGVHTFTLTKSPLLYKVGYADVALEAIQRDGIEKTLDQARDALAEAVQGEVVSDKKAVLEGHPGRDTLIKLGNGHIQLRQFMVGRRLFQVLTSGSKEAIDSPPARSFHESFKLLKLAKR